MPEYKNQHFVPQFYMRGWANNDRVSTYNLDRQSEFPPTNISNLCSEDYFYDKDGEHERALSGLEGRHATLLQTLRTDRSVDNLTRDDLYHLCIFVRFQAARTKSTRSEGEQIKDWIFKEVTRTGVEAGELDVSALEAVENGEINMEFKHHNWLHSSSMLHALAGPNILFDMGISLIENQTDSEFVFSDHPVYLDNRRFKSEQEKFLLGIQNRGLQVFLPLSADLLLHLYDPACYRIEHDDEDSQLVQVDSPQIVNDLNGTQLINADRHIFYGQNDSEDEMQSLQDRLSESISADFAQFERHENGIPEIDRDNPILMSGPRVPDFSPRLPFIKQVVDVEHEVKRSPALARKVEKQIEAAKENAQNTSSG
ncbi:DUF4238 domain-containing protein [Halococcus thailandensis]|nr:DUF4238 domain-containing protein [Halococcus thailandensis]